jgi:shikimate kinase
MIYLLGFMGAGKSTFGKQIAKKHKINFVDTDKEIEKLTNLSIAKNFEIFGEDKFRKIESSILHNIKLNSIIACGGGLPSYKKNMLFIKKSGVSIYLKTNTEELFNRLSVNCGNRPLIQNMSDYKLKSYIYEKLEEREKYYNMADYIIKTDGLTKKEVLAKIDTLLIAI